MVSYYHSPAVTKTNGAKAKWKARSKTAGAQAAARARAQTAGRMRTVGNWGRYAGTTGRATAGEMKFHDIDWDEAAADLSAGVISNTSSLVLIGQGITQSTRIGRKAVIKSIGWRGQLSLASLAGTSLQQPNTIRLILVQDTQCNGAAPDVSGSNGLLVAANFQSFNDLVNKGRFNVMMDKTFVMNTLAGAGNGTADDSPGVHKTFKFFKNCNIPIEYSGVANPSVITELRTNNIFGIMINSGSDSNILLDSKFRFRFQDG